MAKQTLTKRIHHFKTPARRRRELMLVAWEQTKSLDAVQEAFYTQLRHSLFVGDLDWLAKRISTPRHSWRLGLKQAQRIYFISDGEYIKIGIATNPRGRLAELQTSNPRQLKLLYSGRLGAACYQEQHLHQKFSHLRIRGEWFKHTAEIDNQITILKSNEDYFEGRLIDVLFKEPAHAS